MTPDWKRDLLNREPRPRVPAWKEEIRRSSGMSEEGLRKLIRDLTDWQRAEGPEVAVPQIPARAWHRPCECAELRKEAERLGEQRRILSDRLHEERLKRLAATYAAILAMIAAVGLAVTR